MRRPSPPRRFVRRLGIPLAALVLWLLSVSLRAEEPVGADLVVHEWGTFTSVFTSDGVQRPGVHRDDVDLPEFVHPRGGAWGPIQYGLRDALRAEGFRASRANQKMETPVTYFYTRRPMTVSVRVGYPDGLFTHWYPSVRQDLPAFGGRAPVLAGGVLDWGALDLVPAGAEGDALARRLPPVPADDIWQFARETGAAYVRTRAREPQVEKYLFYRGLGEFPSPLTARMDSKLRVTLRNVGRDRLTHVYVLRVPSPETGGRFSADPFAGGASFEGIDAIEPGAEWSVDLGPARRDHRRRLMDVAADLGDRLERSLVSTGLFADEARAMRRTWHNSYFFTPGVRVLYVLSPRQVEEIIPIAIEPKPRELLRVMVGRLEVIDPHREQAVAAHLARAGRATGAAEDRSLEYDRSRLLEEGRFLEPILHGIAAAPGEGDTARLAAQTIAEWMDPALARVAALGPDRVSLPRAEEHILRMSPAVRRARAATVERWLERWEAYAARSKCERTGIRDARTELALLRMVEEHVARGGNPAALVLPEALRVLPVRPASCGCGAARMSGAMPPEPTPER